MKIYWCLGSRWRREYRNTVDEILDNERKNLHKLSFIYCNNMGVVRLLYWKMTRISSLKACSITWFTVYSKKLVPVLFSFSDQMNQSHWTRILTTAIILNSFWKLNAEKSINFVFSLSSLCWQRKIVHEQELRMSLADQRQNLKMLEKAYDENKISKDLYNVSIC